MTPLLLLSYGLQVRGLARLSMWGDSAYSVYSANQTPLEILTNRVYDGHPPLYYELLHGWIVLGGSGELSVRLLSVCFGMAMVAVAFCLGRRLGGGRLGLATAALVALSPELVYYDRLIRMYAGLPCLALLATYLLLRYLREGGRRLLLAFGGVSLAGMYNHYYAILLAAAHAAWCGWLALRGRQRWRPLLATCGVWAALYLPWLGYAAYTQATTTARIISNAPAASGNLGFLEQLWVPFNVGVTLELPLARPLSLAFVLLLAAGVAARWGRGWPVGMRLVAFALLAPIALSYVVFLIYPYAVRPRFMLVVLPLYLALLAWLVLHLRRWHPALPAAGLALALALDIYALADTYDVEAHLDEPDAIQVTQQLDRLVQPGDVVVFHAPWQIGYFESHFRGPRVPALYLLDVDHPLPPTRLAPYARVWLSMYGVRQRDAIYPLEEWLDRHWAKLGEWQFGPNRLGLYARPLASGDWTVLDGTLARPGGPPLVEIAADRYAPPIAAQSAGVTVETRWRALASLGRLTAFLHLVDAAGNRVAGRDAEPAAGADPTTHWMPGDMRQGELGLLVPWDAPPGDYHLELGMYPTPAGQRLEARGPRGPEGNLALGGVRVPPLSPDRLRPWHRVGRIFGGALALVGYDSDLDDYTVASERLLHPSLEESITVRQRRDAYHPGETLNLTLYWRTISPAPAVTLFAHLLDSRGRLAAQRDQSLTWGDRASDVWQPGEGAITRDALALPLGLTPGRFTLRVGLYDPHTLQRLPLTGGWRPADHVDLGPFRVVP